MPIVLVLVVIVALLVLMGRGALRANPAMLASLIRNGGGILTLVGVVLAVMRGQTPLGGVLLAFAIWLLTGAKRPAWPGFAQEARQTRTMSDWLDMQLDHASGEIVGQVLQGPFVGRSLASLSMQECAVLHRDCIASDPRSARLLETYLDRRFAGWGQAGQADADAWPGGRRSGGAGMSEQQAYEILGVKQPATAAEIGGAHRTLMKKCHPDHGGTADEAARVNEARDVLMRRHKGYSG